MTQKIIRAYCRDCCRETKHDVVSEHKDSGSGDYNYFVLYQVISCRGCEATSFRKVFADVEAAYPTEHDEWEVPEEIDIYPKTIKGHRSLSGSDHVPSVVSRIYSEVLLAIQEDARILAGLGLRGIVEAVCNDLGVSGRSLETRIGKLAAAGHISKSDAERLHGIRFMGNDAAHDIRRPEDAAIAVALQIVEHLLASVYILEKEADGSLEPAISKYEKFESLLLTSLKTYTAGDEFPLAQYLGRDLRRVKEAVSVLEQELVGRIKAGTFAALDIGKVDHYKGSKDKLQHFVVKNV